MNGPPPQRRPRSANYEDQHPLFAQQGVAIPGAPFNPRKNQTKSFIQIPFWLFNRTEIHLSVATVYGILIYKCDPTTGIAKIGARKIASMMRLEATGRTIRNYIKVLRKYDLIDSHRDGENTVNEYRFLIHRWMLDSDV